MVLGDLSFRSFWGSGQARARGAKWGSGFRVVGLGILGLGFRIQGLGLQDSDLGLGFNGSNIISWRHFK